MENSSTSMNNDDFHRKINDKAAKLLTAIRYKAKKGINKGQ
jgi:hypothetical protein